MAILYVCQSYAMHIVILLFSLYSIINMYMYIIYLSIIIILLDSLKMCYCLAVITCCQSVLGRVKY